MRPEKKRELATRRHRRVRRKVMGSGARPRMSICFTQENIYVQFIDDAKGVTLASASTRSKTLPDRDQMSANVNSASRIGTLAAEAAIAKGIEDVVFDRGAARYHWSKGKDGKVVHGKLSALAEAARKAGLKF